MQEIMIGMINTFGYWRILLLIAVENIFLPIPSEVILIFGGFMTICSCMTIWGVILFATLGSVIGAIVFFGRLALVLAAVFVKFRFWRKKKTN